MWRPTVDGCPELNERPIKKKKKDETPLEQGIVAGHPAINTQRPTDQMSVVAGRAGEWKEGGGDARNLKEPARIWQKVGACHSQVAVVVIVNGVKMCKSTSFVGKLETLFAWNQVGSKYKGLLW